ncbi:gluconate:H+ symporter [Spelaeicoccus albus]|uniref:GntP family gluconate:H+ symporter n=1 Tax=Spelaeicoccus albus TaxID=1280376 RepID=A0A7Z0AAZ0_9MICO|nr:gluconate:H+ symporter [Spelaeicoccus albus]NYI66871.1 GntP family gluconate:H+ symporter [Spelaeicoccus albus]
MPLVIVAAAIVVLLLLIIKFKVHTFIALVIVSFLTAIALGMPVSKIVESIEGGFGDTLASVGLIFGFGAILGKLIADSGGAQRIAETLVGKFGQRYIQWAVVLVALILGVALFFEVGIVLLVPIVYQMAKQVKLPLMYLGLPMATGLSVMHGFLPPHPGPTVIAAQYHANLGMVLLYGVIIAIPTVVIAGPLFTAVARKYAPGAFAMNKKAGVLATIGDAEQRDLEDTPGFGISALTALFPVILMMIATITDLVRQAAGVDDNLAFRIVAMIGKPSTVMLISVLFAVYTMGIHRKIPMSKLMESAESSVKAVGMLLLIIGVSGSLKEVLINGGVGDYVADMFAGSTLSPLLLAWIIASVVRIAQGSATVAALTTAGLVIPLVQDSDVNLALITLATGAGSLIASHVNDTGFWIVKESFGLSVKETLATWTVLETVIAVCGLGFVLLLGLFV